MLVMRTIFRFAPALFFCGAALLGAPALAQQSGPRCPFPAPGGPADLSCPGDTYPIGNGFCTLRCGPGEEQDPSNEHLCRRASQCPEGRVKTPDGQCLESLAFSCPDGRVETRDGACECGPATVEVGGECLPPSAANCESAGQILVAGTCEIASAAGCLAAGMVYLPGRGTCGAECPPDFESVGGECRDVCRDRLPEGLPPSAGGVCELDRSHGAWSVNLPAAHAMTLADGSPVLGRGVTVAALEPGFLHWREAGSAPDQVQTHSQLPSIRIFGYSTDDARFQERGSPEAADHALAVMGIMAAKKDGDGLVGVAPEADYLFHSGGERFSAIAERLADAGAFVINNSWGPAFLVSASHFRQEDENGNLNLSATRDRIQEFVRFLGFESVETMSQAGRFPNPADRPILAWAAGNDRGHVVSEDDAWNKIRYTNGRVENFYPIGKTLFFNEPDLHAGLARYFPDLAQNNLAVVAVNEFAPGRQDPIVGFSARCGPDSASHCLAAPGVASYVDSRFVDADEEAEVLELFPCAATDSCNFLEDLELQRWFEARRFSNGVAGGFLLAPETDQFRRDAFDNLPGLEHVEGIPEGYRTGVGTSFAAPLVSGGLALVKQYFMRATDCGAGDSCGLGNHEIMQRVLRTADKSGIYADESIYGAGLLDLENALTPQGSLRLLSGRSLAESESHLFSQSGLRPGAALGDSAGRALRGMTLAAFDDLHAPFPISPETVLRGTGRARLDGLGSHLRRWQVGGSGSGSFSFSAFRDGSAWWSLNAPGDSHFEWDERVGSGKEDSPAVFSDWGDNPYSDLAGRGLVAGSSFRLSGGSGFRMAMFGESLGNEKRFRGVLAEFSFSPFADGSGEGEGSRWFAQAGGVREYSGLLASSGSGLFSDLNSRTAFAGLGFAGGLPDGWRYRLGAHWGRTSAEGGAWLSATDSLRSGSYAAGLERSDVFRSGDGLGFRVRQPLRVSGGLKFRVPTGRTKYGELTWSEVSGTPSGRELEWEARYRGGDESGRWGVSAVLVSESGHRSGAKTEGRALFAFERNF